MRNRASTPEKYMIFMGTKRHGRAGKCRYADEKNIEVYLIIVVIIEEKKEDYIWQENYIYAPLPLAIWMI